MKVEYKILENTKKGGTLTLKIEGVAISFNHTLIHEKEVYDEFEVDDFGFVLVKGIKIYHISGHVITYTEFKFVRNVLDDMKS